MTGDAVQDESRQTRAQVAWRLLGCLAISGVAWANVAQGQWRERQELFALDVALGAVAYAVVWWRRRRPLPVAVGLNVIAAFSAVAAGPAVLAAVSLATRRKVGEVVVLGVVMLCSAQTFAVTQPTLHEDPYLVDLGVNFAFIVGCLGWGMYIGSRRELLATLRGQVARAAEEQELRAEKARSDERARIAREMHDVLAHRISQVSMQAGALSFRTDLDADQLREGASVIQRQAHAALNELRAVLGVLRDPGTGERLDRPQPTYDDVAELVSEARAAGTVVIRRTALPVEPMPPATGRTVYRIVQEGLTNARKHAPGTPVELCVSGSPGRGVDVRLRNPVPAEAYVNGRPMPGAGLGLVGLAERAALRGGRLEHREEAGVFELRGWLPWEP